MSLINNQPFLKEFLLLGLVGLAAFNAVYFLEANYFFSIMFFMLLPSIILHYLLKRRGSDDKDILQFSAICLLFIIPYTYLAHLNNVWFETTMLPFRVSNFPLESFAFGFLYVYMNVAFYRYFVESRPSQQKTVHIKPLLAFAVAFFVCFLLQNMLDLAHIPLFYLWANLFLFLLAILFSILLARPELWMKGMVVSLFGFPAFVCFEYTAMKIGNWSFPVGHHVAYAPFFGYTLPVEEFMFALMTPVCIVLLYEFFSKTASVGK